MEIAFNPGQNLNPAATPSVTPAGSQQPSDTTNVSFERIQGLEEVLQRTPDVRPEAVARGSSLVSNNAYPSSQQLDQLASLLSSKLGDAGNDSP